MFEQLRLFGELTGATREHPLLRPIGMTPVLIVELDADGLKIEKVLENAAILRAEGVHAISVADSPSANIRMDSMYVAHRIETDAGISAIPHLTVRDRNVLALHGTLMAGATMGLKAVLALTGDGVKRSDLKAAGQKISRVTDVPNSNELISLIRKLNHGRDILNRELGGRTDYVIGAGVNPNVLYFDKEVKRLERKIESGAQFAMSQILFSTERIQLLYSKTRHLSVPIFAGLLPLLSVRNAKFLQQRMFEVPDLVMQRLEAAGSEPSQVRAAGLAICKDLVPSILKAGAPGFYLVCPKGRIELILELLSCIRSHLGLWHRTRDRDGEFGSAAAGD